jgi:hypothetical protein
MGSRQEKEQAPPVCWPGQYHCVTVLLVLQSLEILPFDVCSLIARELKYLALLGSVWSHCDKVLSDWGVRFFLYCDGFFTRQDLEWVNECFVRHANRQLEDLVEIDAYINHTSPWRIDHQDVADCTIVLQVKVGVGTYPRVERAVLEEMYKRCHVSRDSLLLSQF